MWELRMAMKQHGKWKKQRKTGRHSVLGFSLLWSIFRSNNKKDALFVSFKVRYGRPFSAVSGTRNPSRTDLVVKSSKKLLMGTQCWAQGERSAAATWLFTWLRRCPGCIWRWFYQPSWSPTALSDPVYTASVPSSLRQICCTSPCCCSFSLTSQNAETKITWKLPEHFTLAAVISSSHNKAAAKNRCLLRDYK